MNPKTSLNTLLVEVLSIIIAVILGFVVNEWRENMNNKVKAQAALSKIAIEIEQNKKQLTEKQEYYRQMVNVLDSLNSAKEKNIEGKISSLPNWKGFNPPLLSSSSFKTASTLGVFSYIDFDTADQIAKVYLLQDVLQQLGTTTINSLITGQIKNSDTVKLIFVIHLELINGLLHSYDRVLNNKLKMYERS